MSNRITKGHFGTLLHLGSAWLNIAFCHMSCAFAHIIRPSLRLQHSFHMPELQCQSHFFYKYQHFQWG